MEKKEQVLTFIPEGVCPKEMSVTMEDGVVTGFQCVGGCNGNLKAIGVLLKGMSVEDTVEKLKGIQCRERGTSCADQLAKGLQRWMEENAAPSV